MKAVTSDEYTRWRRPRYFAEMWWCGDEYCDCYQPQIDLVTPNLTVGPPWIRRTRIWEGTFASGGEEDGQRDELREACGRMGIPRGESNADDQPFSIARDVDDLEMAIAHAEGTRPNALFRGGPLDGRALAVGEPPPPDFYAPIPVTTLSVVAGELPTPGNVPQTARYRARLSPPLVYELA